MNLERGGDDPRQQAAAEFNSKNETEKTETMEELLNKFSGQEIGYADHKLFSLDMNEGVPGGLDLPIIHGELGQDGHGNWRVNIGKDNQGRDLFAKVHPDRVKRFTIGQETDDGLILLPK